MAKRGFTLLANFSNPPLLATAITPKIGKPTAVIKNAPNAIHTLSPADCPKNGGNIKFPAPKNSEKSISPTNNKSFLDNFFILFSPF